jgi:hypothetical protein
MTDPLTTNKTFLTPYKYFIDTSGVTEYAAGDDYYDACTDNSTSIYCTIQNAYSDYKGALDTKFYDSEDELINTNVTTMTSFTDAAAYNTATNATNGTFTDIEISANILYDDTQDANAYCTGGAGDCTVATDLSANRAEYETSRANQETVRNSIFSLEAQRKEYGEKAARNSLFYVLLIILILFIIIIIIKLSNK